MDDTDLNLEAPLRDALRRRRELMVPGFTDRAMVAIQRDTRRRKVIRWVSISAPLAGCAALLALFVSTPSNGLNPNEADFARLISAQDKVIVRNHFVAAREHEALTGPVRVTAAQLKTRKGEWESKHTAINTEAWACLMYQAIRVFVLGRVTPKGLSQLPGVLMPAIKTV